MRETFQGISISRSVILSNNALEQTGFSRTVRISLKKNPSNPQYLKDLKYNILKKY